VETTLGNPPASTSSMMERKSGIHLQRGAKDPVALVFFDLGGHNANEVEAYGIRGRSGRVVTRAGGPDLCWKGATHRQHSAAQHFLLVIPNG